MSEPHGFRPLLLLVPSLAAALELPRRLASSGRALAGVYPFTPLDLARRIAEPALLGRGLREWSSGHAALLASRLLDEPHGLRLPRTLPRRPVALALARTLSELRRAGLDPARLERLAADAQGRGAPAAEADDDGARLRALAALYRRFHERLEGRFADPATVLRAARDHLHEARWLEGAHGLVVDDLEVDGLEQEFLEVLARAVPLRRLERPSPPGLAPSRFTARTAGSGILRVAWSQSALAPLAPPAPPPALRRLQLALFEPPAGGPVRDDSVELLTAPGEAAEVRAIARRLLREARRGVPFEQMGVALPRPEAYAPLLTELLERLGVPCRLHPSLPLHFGRSARSLLLLFRCRGVAREAVMEFLTFAPVPWSELLGEGVVPRPAKWDALSREADIVSGRERWIIGLRAFIDREGAAAEEDQAERREARVRRIADAEALLRLVDLLSTAVDGLAGEASWDAWSRHLLQLARQWIGPGPDRERLDELLADLAGLADLTPRAAWSEVEEVLEARFERERLPSPPAAAGAVHVGAFDALAGLPFHVVAIPGLVEGGYPGVLRPDPLLLDAEREALACPAPAPPSAPARPSRKGQLSLFDEDEAPPAPAAAADAAGPRALPTTQDRLSEARRLFHRALCQAEARLILSYPRADPRTGRERLPSLFFANAASALEGRPLSAAELEALVTEDDLESLPLEQALDAGERDRIRLQRGGREAEEAVAAGSLFFKQSRLATRSRWSKDLTPYDGLVAFPPRDAALGAEVRRRLDPVTAGAPISASRLAAFSRCGFQYLLQYVLRLDPARAPEERKRLEPIERGDLFHKVAERFLRERRDGGCLPVRDDAATRQRLLALADAALDELVAGSPPRFTFLWDRERVRFRATVLEWLRREAGQAHRATPAHFEVGFGRIREPAPGEPHSSEPLEIELGEQRVLRVSGKIDRIDRRADGGLVLRDYKTGLAPRDEGGVFRGGRQLQIPFYILAARRLFPGETVVEAFLDYVDGGRQVALDPRSVEGEEFKALLRGLVDAIAAGLFVQEPSACDRCDYTEVCGPRPLLERRRRYKLGDPRVLRVLRLRQVG